MSEAKINDTETLNQPKPLTTFNLTHQQIFYIDFCY